MKGEELATARVTDEHAYVDESLIQPLKNAQSKFAEKGYELIVKDAYRSPELYFLIQKKRYELRGKYETDKLLNMETMPHLTGKAIDVNLIDLKTGLGVKMRNPQEDPVAFFIDFYKDKNDKISQEYQRLQQLLVSVMLSVGFQLGSKSEFWYFEYHKE